MKKYFSILLILLLTMLFHSVAEATITVTPGHPRIFLTPSKVATLNSRAASTHSSTYGKLKAWCETYWSDSSTRRATFTRLDNDYDSGLLRYALIYALGPVSGVTYVPHSINDYGYMAVTIMLDIVAANETTKIRYVGMAYDWVYPRLSSGNKTTIVNWFKATVVAMPTLSQTHTGYRFQDTPYSFYPGLAFYGDGVDDTTAQTYVNFIQTYLDDMRATSHMSGHEGGHAAGLIYSKQNYIGNAFPTSQDLYALLTATTLTLADTFIMYPYYDTVADWFLYGIQPGTYSPAKYTTDAVATLTKFEDCGSSGWNIISSDLPFMQALRLLTQLARDRGDTTKARWLTWLINTRFNAGNQDTTWDILWNDRTTTAVSPTTAGVAKVKAFGWDAINGKIDSYLTNNKAGIGDVYMKSSWDTDAGSSATHAVFSATPYIYFGHHHYSSLAFSIWKKEPLVVGNSGSYEKNFEGTKIDWPTGGVGAPYYWYYYNRTVSKNSLLIMDPTESIYINSAYSLSSQVLKDGGQRGMDTPTGVWGDVLEGNNFTQPHTPRDWGGLIKFEDGTNYTYSSADATKGYNSTVGGTNYLGDFDRGTVGPKTNLVQRDFVYLKSSDGNSDYFVIFDRVNSLNSGHKKVFLLHTVGEPILNGTQTTTYGNSSNGLFESTNTNTFTMTGSTAKLFMKTLYPASTHVYKMGGNVTTTTASALNNTDGTTPGNGQRPFINTINIPVTSTASFSAKPSVVIGEGGYDNEAFMCDGKTSNSLTGCIRGLRIFKKNYALVHNTGATVREDYRWLVRETDTGDWIGYPFNYGDFTTDYIADADEYGRWALRIETTVDENNSNFLHVLFPTTNMGATLPTTTLISSSAGDTTKGALILDSTNPRIVMFAPTTTAINTTTYTVAYSGTGRHLVTGLAKSHAYNLYKNNVYVSSVTSSAQGTYYFTSVGGGTFQIKSPYIVNDTTFYAVSGACTASGVLFSWCTGVGTPTKPPKGTPFIDPVFGTQIVRITDVANDIGGGQTKIWAGYPKHGA